MYGSLCTHCTTPTTAQRHDVETNQVHRIPHKSVKKYVKLWSKFMYVLKNSLTATADFSDTRASETADRRDCNTELYANPKKGSAADARPQQADRLISFCYSRPFRPTFLTARNARITVTAAVSFRTCLSGSIAIRFTAFVHSSPIPSYHRHPFSSLPSKHT